MSKFENMKKLRGLATSPPSIPLQLTDETLKQRLAEIDLKAKRLDDAVQSFDALEIGESDDG